MEETVNYPPPKPATPAALPAKYHPDPTPGRMRLWTLFSRIRSHFWGVFLAFVSDGVTTLTGEGIIPMAKRPHLPEGPLIVVANHSSHADSAVLAATLGRDRPLLFAAAADYWLSSPAPSIAGRSLIGLWPVRRDKGGWEDMTKSIEAIQKGLVLVVFPEGTRTRDGSLGDFHMGAFRLAEASGARILPVALKGTREALEVHGKPHRAVLEARWGTPFSVADPSKVKEAATEARTQMEKLLEPKQGNHPGFGFARVRRLALSLIGILIVGLWAYGEGVSWPLIAEMPLLLMVVTVGLSWRALGLIGASALGSALGIITTWWLVTHGYDPPTPLTTARMHETALKQMSEDPANAFWSQMFNGIPVKVYAHAAGLSHLTFLQLIQSIWPRIMRILLVGGIGWLVGLLLTRYLRPCLGFIQVTCLVLFPFALTAIILWWS